MAEDAKDDSGRKRRKEWSRQKQRDVADIGEIPPVADPARRESCRLDLFKFLTTYFPNTTGISPFSEDHKRVIARIQTCILNGGRFTNAVYRGFAKTTISENSSIWAILYGHRRFVVVFGADATAAEQVVDSVKGELEGNDLLYEDFPEACHAIRALEGKPQRCRSQLYEGELTKIDWTAGMIQLANIPGAKCASGIFTARGIGGGFRGLKVKTPDGRNQRPDLIIADDPQTDESANTQAQVTKTLNIFRKAIVKLGGHRNKLAVVVNATVIQPDDAVATLLEDSAWQGERIAMVRKWPDAHEALWLDQYATIRRTYDKDIIGDQERAHREATAFYKVHREKMDAGSDVSWDQCYDPTNELSALQHAYNALIDDGEEAFLSEYQNAPKRAQADVSPLEAKDIMRRLNRCPRGGVPHGVSVITGFVDVQQESLYWVVCGWEEGFAGHVLDYGCYPEQEKPYFTHRQLRHKLSDKFKGGIEAQLRAGLDQLSLQLLQKKFELSSGGLMTIDRLMVDTGFEGPTVERFCREAYGHERVTPAKGWGISETQRDIEDWDLKEGERRGLNWKMGAPPRRLMMFDSSRWKTFLQHRLSSPVGAPASMMLFGSDPQAHKMFAEHITAESVREKKVRGRTVKVWELLPNRDNHWLDGLVGCAVAASYCGINLAENSDRSEKVPKKTFRQLQEEAREKRRA